MRSRRISCGYLEQRNRYGDPLRKFRDPDVRITSTSHELGPQQGYKEISLGSRSCLPRANGESHSAPQEKGKSLQLSRVLLARRWTLHRPIQPNIAMRSLSSAGQPLYWPMTLFKQ